MKLKQTKYMKYIESDNNFLDCKIKKEKKL